MKYSKCSFKYLVEEDFLIRTPVVPDKRIDTWYCTLYPGGLLVVKKGFASDGASGHVFQTESTKQPAVEHDVFYKLMRKGLIGLSWRPVIDLFLRDRLVEEGMLKCRANIWKKGLAVGGKSAAIKLPKIYTTKHHKFLST